MTENGVMLLLIEDEERDAQLFAIAAEETHLDLRLHTVSNWQAAVEYLMGRGSYGDRLQYPFPHLVVLDLLLPSASATSFVQWCRTSPLCERLPLVILTGTLPGDREFQAALQHGANRAYTKPSSIYDLIHIVREIHELALECKTGHAHGHPAAH